MRVDLSMVRELLVLLWKRYGEDGSWSPTGLLHESILGAVLLFFFFFLKKKTYLFFFFLWKITLWRCLISPCVFVVC